jgi:AcrR family transcriptional regulator
MASETASGAEPPSGGRERLLRASLAYFAEHGIGDASLRQIAAAIGSSHRMLIYHFGSREGLLEAVVEAMERDEVEVLEQLMSDTERPGRELGWAFWTHVADVVELYGPLYFELATRAMRSDDLNAPLRVPNLEMWVAAQSEMWLRAGEKRAQAKVHARLNVAVARGLLHDFLLTRDRAAVDRAMALYDWLCFQEPHPVKRVARMSSRWTAPVDPDR